MPPKYESGEEVRPGDYVTYAGEPARVEFIAQSNDPRTDWYFEQYGGGAMIVSSAFGHIFLPKPDEEEDLRLVARADSPAL